MISAVVFTGLPISEAARRLVTPTYHLGKDIPQGDVPACSHRVVAVLRCAAFHKPSLSRRIARRAPDPTHCSESPRPDGRAWLQTLGLLSAPSGSPLCPVP